jgi:hypothetical protein
LNSGVLVRNHIVRAALDHYKVIGEDPPVSREGARNLGGTYYPEYHSKSQDIEEFDILIGAIYKGHTDPGPCPHL